MKWNTDMKIDAVYAYDTHSESARMIADELGVKIIKHDNSKFKGNMDKVLLNWGCSDLPREARACKIINPENGIRNAVNKLFAFRLLSTNPDIRLPKWNQDLGVVKEWPEKVYCRDKLTGHDGAGITLVERGVDAIPAKLYTAQIGPAKDLREYRINIFRDYVVTRQKKVRVRKWANGYNDDIKTTNGGYGFDIVDQVPLGVIPMTKKAVATLGLDFGGVDVVVYRDLPYILEVNTAPQLTPFTCQRLAKLLKDKE